MTKNQQKNIEGESSSNKPSTGLLIVATVGALIIGAIGGFFGGYIAGSGTASRPTPGFGGPNGMNQAGRFGGERFGRSGFGTVSAISATSITVKNLRQSTDKTYTITASTNVTNDGATANISDIKVGDRVIVDAGNGDTNGSNTETATTIRINPSTRRLAN